MHKRIANNSSRVANRISNHILNSFEHEQIGVVVFNQELHIDSNRDFAIQDRQQPVDFGLILIVYFKTGVDLLLRLFFGRRAFGRRLSDLHGLSNGDKSLEKVLDFEKELLSGVLVQVEAELIGHEHVVAENEILQYASDLFGLVQVD